MKRWFTLILFLVLATSCEGGSFGGKGSTSNKSKGDDKPRPTEQGEGVVGYLVDPNAVTYSEEGGKTTVSGGAGAVEFQGKPESYEACLQELAEEELSEILATGADFGGAEIAIRAKGTVNTDGSFTITMDGTPVGVLAVNVSGFCNSLPAADFKKGGTSVVFKSPGKDGFSKGEGYAEDSGSKADFDLCSGPKACGNYVFFDLFDGETGQPVPDDTVADVSIQISNCKPDVTDCSDVNEHMAFEYKKGATISHDHRVYLITMKVDGYATLKFTISTTDEGAMMFKLNPQ